MNAPLMAGEPAPAHCPCCPRARRYEEGSLRERLQAGQRVLQLGEAGPRPGEVIVR